MQTAVNPPIVHPELDLGSFSYGLAHEAVTSSEYRDRLSKLGRSHRFLVLDNGADELGTGMKGLDYLDLIHEIAPDEIIAPDVIGNPEETIQNTRAFLDSNIETLKEEGISIMAVAQGLEFADWVNCYHNWLADDRVDVIGIPYDIEFPIDPTIEPAANKTEQRAKNRTNLIAHLHNKGMLTKPVHLLGMNNLQEFFYYSAWNLPEIRSTDTTAPFAAALAGRQWTDNHRGCSGEKNWPSLDFHCKPFEQELMFQVEANMALYFAACNDSGGIMNLLEHMSLIDPTVVHD